MTLLLLLALAADLPPGEFFSPGRNGEPKGVQTCTRLEGLTVCCPGKLEEACCRKWVKSAEGKKPACAVLRS